VPRPSVDERRRELLEATCKVVIERGFANTRISDVAHELDVSSGLIHYHFESKGALFAEALRFASESDLARLASTVAEGDTASEKLERVFQLYSPSESEPGWLLWIDSWGEAMRSRELRDISQELDLAWKQTIEKIIVEGVASGEFHCDDPNGAAWRLTALLDGLGVQLTVHEGVVSRGEMIDWVREAAAKELGLGSSATAGSASRRARRAG
jgi:AcrR family transcriptional regulator